MAKKDTPLLEVHLGNDWYSGSRLLRKVDNPHFLPEKALDELPSSAQVMKDGELQKVDDLRSKPSDEELAKEGAANTKVTVPAEVKKNDLKI